tara:strand:+ start:422 stop:565 length:144 start_codon:yes stop_codon:yes gene_type:complete
MIYFRFNKPHELNIFYKGLEKQIQYYTPLHNHPEEIRIPDWGGYALV